MKNGNFPWKHIDALSQGILMQGSLGNGMTNPNEKTGRHIGVQGKPLIDINRLIGKINKNSTPISSSSKITKHHNMIFF